MIFNMNDFPRFKRSVSQGQAVIRSLVVLAIVALIVDYVTLPAYNFHNIGFISLLSVYCVFFAFLYFSMRIKIDIWFKLPLAFAVFLIVASMVLTFLSSEFLNAARYRDQIVIQEQNDFDDEFDLVSINQIPLVDQGTARLLGDKQIGTVQGLGSQFDVNPNYTLINSNNQLYQVSSLEHQDFIKWFQNRNTGIPSYVRVNVSDPSDVSLVTLTEGMKYAPSAFFHQDLMRHVRFKYRTEILEDFSFELDDQGHPYYVISVIEPQIGWFGGWDTVAAIVVDAVSGEMNKYAQSDLPDWVDRFQSVRLAWYQIDNWGYYVNGWLNTLFGQRDMIQTTDGTNFVSIDNQIHVYSGLTSLGADNSIVGFALINLRTKEARFIRIGGADETSAMNSAAGQVQDLRYRSTFPVLINFDGQATYFVALKDNEGLVKLYAMVNVQDYSVVGVGANVVLTQNNYREQLLKKGIVSEAVIISTKYEGIVKEIYSTQLEGNTVYYIILEDAPYLYMANTRISAELALTQVGHQVVIEAYGLNDLIYEVYAFDNLEYPY
jgi:hypothetical protein